MSTDWQSQFLCGTFLKLFQPKTASTIMKTTWHVKHQQETIVGLSINDFISCLSFVEGGQRCPPLFSCCTDAYVKKRRVIKTASCCWIVDISKLLCCLFELHYKRVLLITLCIQHALTYLFLCCIYSCHSDVSVRFKNEIFFASILPESPLI